MIFSHPKTVHIVGPKNSGKTFLLEILITELTNRGFRVGALKHSSHDHPLDRPGSDSDKLRKAGGQPVAFSTPGGIALFLNNPAARKQEHLLSEAFQDCDILLVESFRSVAGLKIAIITDDTNLENLDRIIAVVTRQGKHPDFPAFKPGDMALVDFLIETMQIVS